MCVSNNDVFKVECHGQVIGVIAAEDVVTARQSAKLVKVKYEKLPAILTLEVISRS